MVLDFIAAVISSMEDKERESMFSRALVLDDKDSLHSIAVENSPLVLVAKSTLPILPEQAALIIKKHHLVRLSPRFRQNSALSVQRFNRYNLQAELERAGLSPVQAGQLARKVGGSGVELRRLISKIYEPVESEERSNNLRPLVWIGGWTRSSPGNLEVVQKMCEKCGSNDRDVEFIIAEESEKPNLLFYRDSDIVSLYSKHQAWNMFSSSVRASELDTFLETAVEVLTEQNPVNALPANERMLAEMRGISPQFSNFLKKNIAEALACIASLNDTETINFPGIGKLQLQDKIDGAVSQVLHKGMTTLEWASFGQALCLLAEVSPNTFISAVG